MCTNDENYCVIDTKLYLLQNRERHARDVVTELVVR